MTPREQLKQIGLDYKKIAEFFNLSPGAFQNSTARERYENAVLKVVEYVKEMK